MLVAAWVVGAIAGLIMALATSLFVFVLGVLLYGVTLFVVSPLDSYLTAARGNWSVGRAITFSGIVYNAGAVIGPFTGGWIGDHYGLQTVYLTSFCVFLVSTVFIFFIAPQPRDHHDPENPPDGLLTNRRYRNFLLVFFIVVSVSYTHLTLPTIYSV